MYRITGTRWLVVILRQARDRAQRRLQPVGLGRWQRRQERQRADHLFPRHGPVTLRTARDLFGNRPRSCLVDAMVYGL